MNSLGLGLGLNRLRNIVPKEGLAAFFRENSAGDLVDTIGLSTADYASIRTELQPIFFGAGPTLLDSATIITNIAASPYLNNGWELCGNATKGYALYAEGTDVAILKRAYSKLGETYPTDFGPLWTEPGIWDDTKIWSET